MTPKRDHVYRSPAVLVHLSALVDVQWQFVGDGGRRRRRRRRAGWKVLLCRARTHFSLTLAAPPVMRHTCAMYTIGKQSTDSGTWRRTSFIWRTQPSQNNSIIIGLARAHGRSNNRNERSFRMKPLPTEHLDEAFEDGDDVTSGADVPPLLPAYTETGKLFYGPDVSAYFPLTLSFVQPLLPRT